MASLADDWEQGRQMCIDVLRAYLRMPYTPPAEPNSNGSGDGDAEADGVDEQTQRARLEERQVRHTIIRIITQHLRKDAPVSWQGHDFDFPESSSPARLSPEATSPSPMRSSPKATSTSRRRISPEASSTSPRQLSPTVC